MTRKPKIRIVEGDIWKVAGDLDYIVVPVNVGWTRELKNVMGRGIARQAAQEDPSLPAWYGGFCQEHGKDTPVTSRGRLILFPTKPLNLETPWLSWMSPSRVATIENSLVQLRKWKRPDRRGKIFMPLVGCGNGKLAAAAVLPLLKKYWMNRYRLVVEDKHSLAANCD